MTKKEELLTAFNDYASEVYHKAYKHGADDSVYEKGALKEILDYIDGCDLNLQNHELIRFAARLKIKIEDKINERKH